MSVGPGVVAARQIRDVGKALRAQQLDEGRADKAIAAGHQDRGDQEQREHETCTTHIAELSLAMQLVDVERLYGGERVVVYYLSEDRVDFRQLVKNLAKEFQTRIEMKQIGSENDFIQANLAEIWIDVEFQVVDFITLFTAYRNGAMRYGVLVYTKA